MLRRSSLLLVAGVTAALAALPAHACSYSRSIIQSVPQAPAEGYSVVKLRIVNGLIRGSELIALEGIVVETGENFRKRSLVRFVVPDNWTQGGSCHVTPYGDMLNGEGEAVGYVQLRAGDLPGFHAVPFPASANQARLRALPSGIEWQKIRFGDVD